MGQGDRRDTRVIHLQEALRIASSTLDLNQVVQRVLAGVVSASSAQVGCLALEDGGHLVLKGGFGTDSVTAEKLVLGIGGETCRRAMASGEPVTESMATSGASSPLQPAAVLCVPIALRGKPQGVLFLANYQFGRVFTEDHCNLVVELAALAAVAIDNARLFEQRGEIIAQSLAALASAIDAAHPDMSAHSERVTQYALMIARQVKYSPKDSAAWARLERGARLHDIGMVGLPDAILHKIGPLTDEEFATMKTHTTKGFAILSGLSSLTDELVIARSHHERFDGTGYPDRKRGDELPIVVWIVSAADAIDAMTSDRAYGPGLPLQVAVDQIRAGAGTQFHPDVAQAVIDAALNGTLKVVNADLRARPAQSSKPDQVLSEPRTLAALPGLQGDTQPSVVIERQSDQPRQSTGQVATRPNRQTQLLHRVAIALSAERNISKLQDLILSILRELTNADGASLWLKSSGQRAQARLTLAASQIYSVDRSTYQAFTIPIDEQSIVGYTFVMGVSQMYDDVYNPPPGKPPAGTGFDAQFGYRTKSMLTVPMRNYDNEVVGAIQLINAKRRFETKLTADNADSEVVSFRPEDLSVVESIASQAAAAIDSRSLLDSMYASFDGFVRASIVLIQQRDATIAGHSFRVATLANGLARAVNELAVGKYRDVRFTEDQFTELRYACLLHDIGLLAVREHILVKASTLSDEERLEVQSHVIHTFQFLSTIPWPPQLRNIPEIAYAHHEKLDGSGYPRGLTNDQIPIQTRMMTIADIYDALTAHDRLYKRPLPVDRALDILRSEAEHGALDPDLVEVFTAKRIYELTSPRGESPQGPGAHG